MKKQENDRLRSLFQDMELSTPPKGFENRLMQQIHLAAAQNEKKRIQKNKIYTTVWLSFGIAGMVALPLVVFYFFTGSIGFELSSLSFEYSLLRFPKIDINPIAIFLPLVILGLVMGDTLIRKYISEKRHHS